MAKIITLQEFSVLPKHEQLDIVFSIGKYIKKEKGENLEFILYAVDRFFVEFDYHPKLHKIYNIYPFESGDRLDKYSINLNEIF